MSFFIPGRTRCPICNSAISDRWEAAQLPYVAPAALGALTEFARRFVHRACWDRWDHAEAYANAASSLVQRGADEAIEVKKVYDSLIVFFVKASNVYRLQDFSLVVVIDFPAEESGRLLDLFLSVFRGEPVEGKEYVVSSKVWRARPLETAAEFSLCEGDEILERFRIPENRFDLWAAAIRDIKKGGIL